MDSKPSDPVLIVGAGPVGLILAHELARRGIPLRLIERRPGPSHTTRAFTLHARSMEMFEHIGLAHRLEQVSLPCPGNVYHFRGVPTEQAPRTDFRNLPTRYPFYYKLNQNDFEQVLREHLLAHHGIAPEYGTELVDLEAHDERVRVTIKNGKTEKTEASEYPWVIGADGSRSRVRQVAGIDFPGERVGVMAMMDVEIEGFPHDDSWVNYIVDQNLFMLVTKLPGRFWRVYLSDVGAMTKADNPQASFQEVSDRLGIGMKLEKPHWASQWDILNNIAETYRRGRILLCGDASHVHSPAGGQGMNGSMQDAFNLGWKLASVYRGDASARILDSYEAERKPIGMQITAGAKATHDIVMAFGKGLEDRIAITREPEWQERSVRLISGLAHNYRDVVRIPDGATEVAGPKPGDRAPDARLIEQPVKRVFDLLRHGGFTLLLVPGKDFEGDVRRARAAADELEATRGQYLRPILVAAHDANGAFDADHWVPDSRGELAKAYGIREGESRAILVRPDMYIGMHTSLADVGLHARYLEQWFS